MYHSSENEITIDGNASETIDGATTVVLYVQHDAFRILCDGANWHIIADERIPHSCRLERNTAQALTHGAWTTVPLNSESYDVGGIGDPTTNNSITIKRPGKYQISIKGGIIMFDDDRIGVAALLNGTTQIDWILFGDAAVMGSGGTSFATSTFVYDLVAGDELELQMWQSDSSASGSKNSRTGTGANPFLSVTEIR